MHVEEVKKQGAIGAECLGCSLGIAFKGRHFRVCLMFPKPQLRPPCAIAPGFSLFQFVQRHVVLAYSNALGSKVEHVIGHLNAANNLNFVHFMNCQSLCYFPFSNLKIILTSLLRI